MKGGEYIMPILPYIVILTVFFWGATIYKKSFSYESAGFRFSRDVTRRSLDRITKWYKKEFESAETDRVLKQAGIKLSAFSYQIIRYSLLIIWLGYITYIRLYRGTGVNIHVLLWLVIFIVSRPSLKLLNFRSPFSMLCDLVNKRKREKCDVEIFRVLSQLKNMVISMSQKALSSEYLIGEITKYTKATRPYFMRMLAFWYEGRYKEGQEYFASSIGTEAASSIAGLIGKLDYIPPEQFISQIELYQNQVEDKRKTAVKNVREHQGNVVFVVAMLSGIAILINFLAVAVGIDTLPMLQKISF